MMITIPNDVILDIFSRLPAKSIVKFHCVSKLWRSMLCGQHFTELFLTRSSARPRRLLFAIQGTGENECHFYSSPQPHNPYEKSSLVVEADSYMTCCPKDMCLTFCGYVSGLICFYHGKCIANEIDALHVICNPSTGKYVFLPKLEKNVSMSYLGFDPIDKEFKVMCIDSTCFCAEYRTLTLGTEGEMSWRKIPMSHRWFPVSESSICINGVLYYLARPRSTHGESYMIACFDVRSEKFKFIKAKGFYDKLINYKGKLGGITLKYDADEDGFPVTYLNMWVLQNVEKRKWSEYDCTLPHHEFDSVGYDVSVVGVIATGEIVLSMDENMTCKPFCVFYFHPERNSLHKVVIQGLENPGRVLVFVDHVEDLNLNVAKFIKSSISAPSVKNKSHVRGRDIKDDNGEREACRDEHWSEKRKRR